METCRKAPTQELARALDRVFATPGFTEDSGSNGGQCIEVATSNRVHVRDSKDPDRARLGFSARAWREFAARLKSGNSG